MKSAQLVVTASLVFGALGLHVTPAQANCAMPKDYHATVEGNTVTVCAQGQCDTAGTLLREDVATGTVVELSSCTGTDAGPYSACWVDECVAAGSYRYGLKSPYSCCSACCGTYYYGAGLLSDNATVVTAPLGECTPSGEVPAAYAGKPPWDGKSQTICQYTNPNGSGGSNGGTGGANPGSGGSINGTGGANPGVGGSTTGVGGASTATGGASGAAGGNQAAPEDDAGGCSVAGGGLNRTVLGIHALALVVGLLFAGRARGRRS